MIKKLPNLQISETVSVDGNVETVKITTFASEAEREAEIAKLEEQNKQEEIYLTEENKRQSKRLEMIKAKIDAIKKIKSPKSK